MKLETAGDLTALSRALLRVDEPARYAAPGAAATRCHRLASPLRSEVHPDVVSSVVQPEILTRDAEGPEFVRGFNDLSAAVARPAVDVEVARVIGRTSQAATPHPLSRLGAAAQIVLAGHGGSLQPSGNRGIGPETID